jgi:3-isopropylmalate/(R)-2-methylmalate dehydratase small subunit
MQIFTQLTAIAAVLPLANIDTDMIIPKQFLKTIARTGLGRSLFYDLRMTPDGHEKPDFILNQDPFRQAQILLTGANFGCGSSREHAPWALLDFGIRCVIAPSFADIFHGNCFKNGILPVILPPDQIEALMQVARQALPITVDLEQERVTEPTTKLNFGFKTDPFRRTCLLQGLDEIGLTLQHDADITAYEAQRPRWL